MKAILLQIRVTTNGWIQLLKKALTLHRLFLWGFGRSDESIRPAFEMLKRGAMPKSKSVTGQLLNSLLGDGEPGSVRDQKIDGSTLPDFELIEKYFGTSGFVMQNLKDGWRLGGITLARPEASTQDQDVATSPNK